MSVQPVEISKAYRLLQVGSTTMISAKYDGVENVMSAAWVGLAGERKVGNDSNLLIVFYVQIMPD
ncbi:TPA: hypothetical protein MAF92_004897, partial [Klebsiella pneumoniae]|nr:hypothetical protein [Klebsiella pneumoniae]